MADSPILPGSHSKPIAPSGTFATEWYRYFRDLIAYIRETQGNSTALAELEARVAALEEQTSPDARILGPESVQVNGLLETGLVLLRLVGDVPSPEASSYYGTDASGARGWYQRLLATLADVDFSTPPGVDDVLKFDGTSWVPGQAAAAQVFNYITTDGEPYCTEDYADLYTGVI